MTRRLILHIGFPKTGTTAIQMFCSRYRAELPLEGYYYPFEPTANPDGNTGLTQGAYHVPFYYHILKKNRPPVLSYLDLPSRQNVCEDIVAAFERSGLETLIISHELLSAHATNIDFEKLNKLFAGYQIKIIAYVRRLDDWHEAMYQQSQRSFHSQYQYHRIEAYMKDMGSFSFYKRLNTFRLGMPTAEVQVRSYDEIKNGPENFLFSFIRDIGISEEKRHIFNMALELQPVNISMSSWQLELHNKLKEMGISDEALANFRRALDLFNRQTLIRNHQYFFISQSLRKRLLKSYTKEVKLINRTFNSRLPAHETLTAGADAPEVLTIQHYAQWFGDIEPFIEDQAHRNRLSQAIGRLNSNR